MKYEIVEVNEKTVAGIHDRMKDNDEITLSKIENMWRTFCDENGQGAINDIKDRLNHNTVAVYFDYSNEDGFEYTNLVGCEVEKESVQTEEHIMKVQIPKGRYAKFTLHGNPQTEVSRFWQEFWTNFGESGEKLERTYAYDFEEYVAGDDCSNMEINIYIAVK